MSKPRLELWSLSYFLKCSVRSFILSVSRATCTSGEPVSFSCSLYPSMIVLLCAVSNDMLIASLSVNESFYPDRPRRGIDLSYADQGPVSVQQLCKLAIPQVPGAVQLGYRHTVSKESLQVGIDRHLPEIFQDVSQG